MLYFKRNEKVQHSSSSGSKESKNVETELEDMRKDTTKDNGRWGWERKPVGTQVRLTKIREHQLDTTKQWNKKYRNTETRLKDQNT